MQTVGFENWLALSAYSVYADNFVSAYSVYVDNCLSAYSVNADKCLSPHSLYADNCLSAYSAPSPACSALPVLHELLSKPLRGSSEPVRQSDSQTALSQVESQVMAVKPQ